MKNRDCFWKQEVKEKLEFLENYIGALYGVELCERYDKNFLISNNNVISRDKVDLLNRSRKLVFDLTSLMAEVGCYDEK